MTKNSILRTIVIFINVLYLASLFLPYRVERNSTYNGNEDEYLSGFETVIPLLALLFLIPIGIIFFISKKKGGRIANLILSILLLVFSGLCFLVVSFGLFVTVKAGIGAYLLILCALILFVLSIIHFRMPTMQIKSKDLLDDF